MIFSHSLIPELKEIIHHFRDKAIRLVDHERTLMYWRMVSVSLKKSKKVAIGPNMAIMSLNLLQHTWSRSMEVDFPKGR